MNKFEKNLSHQCLDIVQSYQVPGDTPVMRKKNRIMLVSEMSYDIFLKILLCLFSQVALYYEMACKVLFLGRRSRHLVELQTKYQKFGLKLQKNCTLEKLLHQLQRSKRFHLMSPIIQILITKEEQANVYFFVTFD